MARKKKEPEVTENNGTAEATAVATQLPDAAPVETAGPVPTL